eukprot:jgi/Botrbrau1/2206/Bobra.101_2s0036.1
MPKGTGIQALSHDCLRLLASFLTPLEYARLGSTCKDFKQQLLVDETAWELHCKRLFQDPAYPALADEVPSHFISWSGLRSFAQLYRALYQLGCWPEGVWRQLDLFVHPEGLLWHGKMEREQRKLVVSTLRSGQTEPAQHLFSVECNQEWEPAIRVVS